MAIADLDRHEVWRPESLAALLARLAERHAAGAKTVLLAGGTDWVVEQEMAKPSQPGDVLPLLADISCLGELRGISLAGSTLRVGAATTYLEMRRHEEIDSGRVRLTLAIGQYAQAWARAEAEAYYRALSTRYKATKQVDPVAAAAAASANKP